MFKINLQYNKGFKWNNSENIHSKGYLFDKENNLYQGENLNTYFNCVSEEIFRNKIKSANGSFAIVIQKNNKLWIGVDRLRSIPLFYALQNNIFYLSDNAYWIKDKLGLKELDKISEQEFLLTGYVTGKDTLFTEIKQIQAGEYLIVKEANNKITVKNNRYYRYLHKNYFTKPKEELFNKLDKASENIFKRLINSINGRTIIIPLSGGYDSRYIAAMLKKIDYKNVVCFSYGKKGNWESEISEKVAKKLGCKWYFIEYTKIKWRDWFNSREMKKYHKYGNNLTSLVHWQDWPAVWELKKTNKIPDNAVFVPGHSGDLLGGSWTPKPLDISKTDYNLNDISNYLFKRHYCLFNLEDAHKKGLLLNRIKEELRDLEISIAENYVSLSDCWNISNRQAKFIVNSLRAYEFFGYQWRIPLSDSELMDFWSRVPLKYRIKKELYDEYLFERIFFRFNIDTKKYKTNTKVYDSIKKSIKLLPNFLIYIIKNILFRIVKQEGPEEKLRSMGVLKEMIKDIGINSYNESINLTYSLNSLHSKLQIWILKSENYNYSCKNENFNN